MVPHSQLHRRDHRTDAVRHLLERGAERASWGTIKAAVKQAYPAAMIVWMEAPRYPHSAAEVVVDLPHQDHVRVYVDPYTAEVQGARSYFNVQCFFRSFHYSLFLPEVGLYVVSVFALAMLTSLVAALVFYKRWWRCFLRLPGGSGRAFWSELHKTGGLWSIWFLVVISLTGAWYLFEVARSDLGDGKGAYAGTGDFAVHDIPHPVSDTAKPALPLDVLIARVRELRPRLDIRTVSPSFSHDGALYVNGQAAHLLVRDRANQLHLDARTGDVLYNQSASDLPPYWRWSHTADPLHFGGLWSKGVWFVFGLVLSGLILTGTWLHAHRLARQVGGRARHRWPGTGAAIVVSLVVLAATVPFGFHEAREFYGQTVDGVKQLPTLAPGVKAVIIGWVAVTLAIIAGWVLMLWRPQVVASTSAVHRVGCGVRQLNR